MRGINQRLQQRIVRRWVSFVLIQERPAADSPNQFEQSQAVIVIGRILLQKDDKSILSMLPTSGDVHTAAFIFCVAGLCWSAVIIQPY